MVTSLKIEVETIKKTGMEATLEMENIGKTTGDTDASINSIFQEIKKRKTG